MVCVDKISRQSKRLRNLELEDMVGALTQSSVLEEIRKSLEFSKTGGYDTVSCEGKEDIRLNLIGQRCFSDTEEKIYSRLNKIAEYIPSQSKRLNSLTIEEIVSVLRESDVLEEIRKILEFQKTGGYDF